MNLSDSALALIQICLFFPVIATVIAMLSIAVESVASRDAAYRKAREAHESRIGRAHVTRKIPTIGR